MYFSWLFAVRRLGILCPNCCVSQVSHQQEVIQQVVTTTQHPCIVQQLVICSIMSMSGHGLQIRAQSENDADDELLSVVLLKGDKKVVTGTQSGVINLYSWGHMDDCSDRFPGAPALPAGAICLCRIC